MQRARFAFLLLVAACGGARAGGLWLCRQPGGGLVGYGDSVCRITVPYRYESAEPFTADGLAVVTVESTFAPRVGVVGRDRKEVIAPVHDRVKLGPDGQILVTTEHAGCPMRPAPMEDTLFDATGHALLSGPFAELRFFHEGLAAAVPARTGDAACAWRHDPFRKPDLHGFVDRSGHFVIPPQFEQAYDFAANGLAAVEVGGKWGFVDRQGRMAIPAQYERIAPTDLRADFDQQHYGFDETGVVRVETRDGVQLIDAQGHAVGSGGWWSIGPFNAAGVAWAIRAAGPRDLRDGLIDTHGKVLLEPTYRAAEPFANGFAAVARDGKWGFIDASGALVVPTRYDWVAPFGRHGVAKVLLHPGRDPMSPDVKSLGYGFVDSHGKVVLDKDDYDDADDFQDAMDQPLARVTRGGRTAYVDLHGQVALGWFEAGTLFGRDGLAAVKTGGKFGYIDRSGRFVIAPAYERAERFDGDALAVVMQGGKWGMVDHAGKVVVPFEYERLAAFKGRPFTRGRRGGHDMAIDASGHAVELPPLGPRRGVPADDR